VDEGCTPRVPSNPDAGVVSETISVPSSATPIGRRLEVSSH